jgi:predicted glutamine amidotransferase
MCELFAMSALVSSDVVLSMNEFSLHGGATGPHRDGWGIAYYEDGDVRLIKEATPAFDSEGLRHLQAQPFRSAMTICHIRKATQGTISTRNNQPFIRELGGHWHTFAHNGNLKNIEKSTELQSTCFRAVGETDSELAFCAMLERLQEVWRMVERPSVSMRVNIVEDFANELRKLGPANFLYSDGDVLFAHSHQRHQQDGTVRAPGLWSLTRHCTEGGVFDTSGLTISAQNIEQDVVLVASVPLSGEGWCPIPEGRVLAIRSGKVLTEQ